MRARMQQRSVRTNETPYDKWAQNKKATNQQDPQAEAERPELYSVPGTGKKLSHQVLQS